MKNVSVPGSAPFPTAIFQFLDESGSFRKVTGLLASHHDMCPDLPLLKRWGHKHNCSIIFF